MSLFWSQWFPQFWNGNTLSWLVKDWKIQVIRAAMAVNRNGYVQNPIKEKAKMVAVIESSIKLGIYVIVDWHAENENPQIEHAKRFFTEIARKYGRFPNVLFETFNEPSPNSWPSTKKYHEVIVPIIRKYSKNICILGTATWSQDVDLAARDPVSGENLAYTLHFYASTHKQTLRDKADYALKKGIAIFITEWGTCESSGTGKLDFPEANIWLNWARQRKIGNTNWGIYDKEESCAVLKPGSSGGGSWDLNELTKSGNYLRNYLRNGVPKIPVQSPTKPVDESGNSGPGSKGSGTRSSYGCCTWDGGVSCGETTEYCKAKKSHCENDCEGKWKPGKSSEGSEKECCSWDGKKSCGKTSEWCNANKQNCQGHCLGEWMG